MAAIKKAISIAMLEFVAKIMENENEHLKRHTICLINDLESLQSSYLTEHNLTSIALIVRFLKQARIISKQFNNLPLIKQVQMIHTILNKKEIHLHAMIKTTLE